MYYNVCEGLTLLSDAGALLKCQLNHLNSKRWNLKCIHSWKASLAAPVPNTVLHGLAGCAYVTLVADAMGPGPSNVGM